MLLIFIHVGVMLYVDLSTSELDEIIFLVTPVVFQADYSHCKSLYRRKTNALMLDEKSSCTRNTKFLLGCYKK